jgi:hypothetical protein
MNCIKTIKRLERLRNTVNKYIGRLTTRSTYDLPVRTESGRKSTTRCISLDTTHEDTLRTETPD